MSREVIDLTRVDDDAGAAAGGGDADASAARRAAKRARRRAAAASAGAEVIDLSRDECAGAAGSGRSGRVRAPFACGICLSDCAAADGHALFCGHVYCRDCLGAHCASQVGDGLPDAGGVPCPEPKCRAPLTGADVAAVADAPTAARFEALALEQLVQKNRDSMGCCPTPGCSYLFAWDPANRKLVCPLCSKAYCVHCQSDWHRGVRCEDRTPEGAQAAFERAAKRGHYKKCPKCAVWVEKADGCDNMKCRCGANFCYKCGSRLARAHAAHKCIGDAGQSFHRTRW